MPPSVTTLAPRVLSACPAPWRRMVRRMLCPHTGEFRHDSYDEELRGHYDEYICTRRIEIFRCWSCGRARRVVTRVLAA